MCTCTCTYVRPVNILCNMHADHDITGQYTECSFTKHTNIRIMYASAVKFGSIPPQPTVVLFKPIIYNCSIVSFLIQRIEYK